MNLDSDETPSALTMVVARASDHADGIDLTGLTDYLSDRIELPINLVYCTDYGEAIDALVEGRAQVGWLGPYAYLEAARKGIVEPFAVGLPEGKPTPNYHSVFIAALDSPIESLSDVKNKRIAVSDHHSTSGYIVPKRELMDVGIHLENDLEFAQVIAAKDHDEAIRQVLEGKADVAPVSSVNLQEQISKGRLKEDGFKVVHRSPDIPGAPLVYLAALPTEVKTQIKDLVLDAHNHIDVGGYGGAMARYVDPAQSRTDYLASYLRPQWGWRTHLGITALLAITALVMIDLDVQPMALIRNTSSYLIDVVGRMLPPDFSDIEELLYSMLETIEIAFLGTLLAIVLSIPIGLMSARNIAPNYPVYLVARTITIFFRAIPEFIMAMILVIAIGFGAMPGVLALGFHTMGFLAKFYAEDMEHVKTGPINALEATGAKSVHVLVYAVVPQIIPSFVGNNLYILDRNIRMATMLGIVGAGGIGYELQSAFRMFEYQRVSAIILVIFVAIFLIDMLSSHIRAKVQ